MEQNVRKRGITVRFSDSEITSLVREKNRRGFDNVSDFIRAATLEKINSEAISNVAGKNKIHYNPENDTFDWKIQLDEGNEVEVLSSLSTEFIQNLCSGIRFELNKREELLKKKRKDSVAIPKRLVKK